MKLAKSIAVGAAFYEDVTYYDVYGVDEDGDGVNDGYLFIEESDTRA
jgi:hypothetical protein